MTLPPLNIVLVHPEIPNNTGNIGRTAAAAGCRLHIIHPIGFDMTGKARRRAGLDYWHLVDCREHASWEAFLEQESPSRAWLLTTRGTRTYWDADYQPNDYFLFGSESAGVPDAVRQWLLSTNGEDHELLMPMQPGIRSLNLATTACAAVYEARRQLR